jgi:hypothetical protein
MAPGVFLEKNFCRSEKNFQLAPDFFNCFFNRSLVAQWKSAENSGFTEHLTPPGRKAEIFES